MWGMLETMGRQGSAGRVWYTRLGHSNPQSVPIRGTASFPVPQSPRGQVQSETETLKSAGEACPSWRQGGSM